MEEFSFRDDFKRIGRVLANLPRYNGDFPEGVWYSVGHHVVLLARHIRRRHPGRPDWALAALHHDDQEALLGGDVIAPLRHLVPALSALQERVGEEVMTSLGLPPALPDEVQECDVRIRADEGPWCRPDLDVQHWARYGQPLALDPVGFLFPGADLCVGGRVSGRRFRSCPRRVAEAYACLHHELVAELAGRVLSHQPSARGSRPPKAGIDRSMFQ